MKHTTSDEQFSAYKLSDKVVSGTEPSAYLEAIPRGAKPAGTSTLEGQSLILLYK